MKSWLVVGKIFGDAGGWTFLSANVKSTLEVMMFGWGSAFHALPQVRGIVQGLAGKID